MKNKTLFEQFKRLRYPNIPKTLTAEYRLKKFNTNNSRVFIVSIVLVIEQFLLGLVVAEPDSMLRHVYFVSSAVMGLFTVVSILFFYYKPSKIRKQHELYEMSFAVFGMTVAVARFLIVETGSLTVPTIYIAVLYGVAVIFVFTWWQGLLTYSVMTIATVILLPVFHPGGVPVNFISDVVTNGLIAWVVVHLNSRRYIQTFLDQEHIRLINSELREQSIRDGLTGLYNRRKLDEVLGEVCLKAERYENDFAVMIMDIDHFKNVNDRHGHHIGDSVLREIARILEQNIREVDVCGRWGGEEFLVICQETELKPAYLLAERLRVKIEKYVFSSGLHITASFGLSSWRECKNSEFLIKTADTRLYKAKNSGRNRVVAGTSVESGSLFD